MDRRHQPSCPVCGVRIGQMSLPEFTRRGQHLFFQLSKDEQHGYDEEDDRNMDILCSARYSHLPWFKIIARTTDAGAHSGSTQPSEPGVFISSRGEWRRDQDWETNVLSRMEMSIKESLETANAGLEKIFPLHASCADIFQHFTQHQSRSHSSNLPKSIKDFVDACVACQEFSKDEWERIYGLKKCKSKNLRPPNYHHRQYSVEWSHLYFGARCFWDDYWTLDPRHIQLYADPESYPRIDPWIAGCLTLPKSSSPNLFSLTMLQLQPQDFIASQCPLMRCPTEILRLIASHLPLRSAINLHASSRRLSAMINESERDFWCSHTLRLHGGWFWELTGHRVRSTDAQPYANWEMLLIILSLNRQVLIKGANIWWMSSTLEMTFVPLMDMLARRKISERVKFQHGTMKVKSKWLPGRLRNRQRIWMCLESLDPTGETVKLSEDKSRCWSTFGTQGQWD